jgi:thiol-disulfide isomerase/thioredoxin
MLSISLGPVALPVLPLLVLATLWLAASLAARAARRGLEVPDGGSRTSLPAAAENAVWVAGLLGLVAARLAFVALNGSAYAAAPVSMLDIRDGGWWAPAGWLVGSAWLLRCAWRRPELRRALLRAASVLALLALGLMAWRGLENAARMPPVPLVELDGAAPSNLAQAAGGKPVVVNLWATWCAPCRAEMPVLAAAQQRESAVAFVFVNQGEGAETVQRYLAREKLPLRHVLLDPAQALGPAVGSRGLPTTLFYDAQGRQVHAHFGILNAAALESRLQSLRAAH